MTSRTWTERGAWMDKHGAMIFANRAKDAYDNELVKLQWHMGDPTQSRYTYAPNGSDAVRLAMDECDRLEKEAAERAKKADAEAAARWDYERMMAAFGDMLERYKPPEPKKDTASRSPVAALLKRCEGIYYLMGAERQLRAAIKAQADLWRKEADAAKEAADEGHHYSKWALDYERCKNLRRCADELEGK